MKKSFYPFLKFLSISFVSLSVANNGYTSKRGVEFSENNYENESLRYTLPNEIWMIILNKLYYPTRAVVSQVSFSLHQLCQDDSFKIERGPFLKIFSQGLDISNVQEFIYQMIQFSEQGRDVSSLRPDFDNDKSNVEKLNIYKKIVFTYNCLTNKNVDKEEKDIEEISKKIIVLNEIQSTHVTDELKSLCDEMADSLYHKTTYMYFLNKSQQSSNSDSEKDYYTGNILNKEHVMFSNVNRITEKYNSINQKIENAIDDPDDSFWTLFASSRRPNILEVVKNHRDYYRQTMIPFFEKNTSYLRTFRESSLETSFKKEIESTINNQYNQLNNIYKGILRSSSLSDRDRAYTQAKRLHIVDFLKKNLDVNDQDSWQEFYDEEWNVSKNYIFKGQSFERQMDLTNAYYSITADIIEKNYYYSNDDESIDTQAYVCMAKDLSQLIYKECSPYIRVPLYVYFCQIMKKIFESHDNDLKMGLDFYDRYFLMLQDIETQFSSLKSPKETPDHYFNLSLKKEQDMYLRDIKDHSSNTKILLDFYRSITDVAEKLIYISSCLTRIEEMLNFVQCEINRPTSIDLPIKNNFIKSLNFYKQVFEEDRSFVENQKIFTQNQVDFSEPLTHSTKKIEDNLLFNG